MFSSFSIQVTQDMICNHVGRVLHGIFATEQSSSVLSIYKTVFNLVNPELGTIPCRAI